VRLLDTALQRHADYEGYDPTAWREIAITNVDAPLTVAHDEPRPAPGRLVHVDCALAVQLGAALRTVRRDTMAVPEHISDAMALTLLVSVVGEWLASRRRTVEEAN
jgi:hypothetical protein